MSENDAHSTDERRAAGDHSLGRCLLTGATGEIGSYCVRKLNRMGVRPTVVLRRPLAEEAWQGAQVDIVEADLAMIAASPRGLRECPASAELPPSAAESDQRARTQREALASALARADTVFHLAARVNLAGRGREHMEQLNLRGTIALFDLACQTKVKRFLHVSTTGAVGCAATPEALNEEAHYNLEKFRNPYFVTKRLAEETILAHWRESDRATDLVVVNPPIVMGPQGSFRRTSRPRRRPLPRPGSFWLRCLRFWWPGGLNIVDVRDVSEGILLAAARGAAGRRYILGGDNVSVRELMERAHEIFGTGRPSIRMPIPLLKAAARGTRVWEALGGGRSRFTPSFARLLGYYWYYDSTRARTELGYASRPLEETLRDVREWWEREASGT
ncbi:MAG: NAD-dependent epimerase/dehydratase family protein [Candidatus Eisenbacteria bacterium]|nr:NAD-dependent epimerase/dehydratase family protein [Candidatus Eisenbacteria bacterium]